MVLPSLLVLAVVVAADLSADSTMAGEAPVLFERKSAPAPAPCGEAMEVPDIVVVPPPRRVERMLTPGAQRSTQDP